MDPAQGGIGKVAPSAARPACAERWRREQANGRTPFANEPVLELPSFAAANHRTQRVRLPDENVERGLRGSKPDSNP